MKTNITTINLNLSCQQGDLYEKERGFGLHDSFPSKQIFLKDLFIESIKKNVEWINQGLPRIDNIGSENEEERKEFLPLNSKLFHDIIKNQDLVSDRSIQLKTPSSLKKLQDNSDRKEDVKTATSPLTLATKYAEEKSSQFDAYVFKPMKGESEEMATERLKNLLKLNYKIDVPNDTFDIYFERNDQTNRKRRMLRCRYQGCSKSFK